MAVRASHDGGIGQKCNGVTLTGGSEVESREVSFNAHEVKLKTWLSCDSHLFANVPE